MIVAIELARSRVGFIDRAVLLLNQCRVVLSPPWPVVVPSTHFEGLNAVTFSMADSPESEAALLLQIDRDLEAVSLSDEDEDSRTELPDTVPLGSLSELLAAAAQQVDYTVSEDSLAQLRESLQAGERRRQCFVEDVAALQGLASTVEQLQAEVGNSAAEASAAAADGDEWAGEEPWWVDERRQQAEAERAREE